MTDTPLPSNRAFATASPRQDRGDGAGLAARPSPACPFCGSSSLVRTHTGLYHPRKPDHGPFDFHRCRACGSGLTFPLPSRESLAALYASFRDGLPEFHRTITADDPQVAIEAHCVGRLLAHAAATGLRIDRWIELGAGGGELSRRLAEALPEARGLAVDLHPRPASLDRLPQVEWRELDAAGDDLAERLGLTAPVVVSVAVWEHVPFPDRFAASLARLVEPGGMVYLLTPDYGSPARRLLGRRWPYFTPGEHLNMPTVSGARAALGRAWAATGRPGSPVIRSRSLLLPYTVRYVFRRLGLDSIGRLIPPGVSLPFPAGALEAWLEAPGE